jgi:ABC-type nitrate/sulfonate/bicarbonate transport system permease component
MHGKADDVIAFELGISLYEQLHVTARTQLARSDARIHSSAAGFCRYPSRHFVSWAIEQNVGSVIAFGAIWPVLLASVHGFSSVPLETGQRGTSARVWPLGFPPQNRVPSALPDIVAGLRVSLAIALILTVVTEMQSSLPGLGWDIFSAQRFYRSADLYAGLIMLALLGFAANHLILLLEWRVLRWRDLRT